VHEALLVRTEKGNKEPDLIGNGSTRRDMGLQSLRKQTIWLCGALGQTAHFAAH